MNLTLMTTLWRQRATSPVRMAIAGILTGMPLLAVAFMPAAGLAPLGGAHTLVLTLGAGMIGQDVSSGVLHLLLARPVRRSEYVLSRWLGVGIAAAVVSLLQLGIACGVLAARGAPPTPQDALMFGSARVIESFATAAVLALLSSLIGGFGDLGLYLVASLVAGVLQMVGQAKHWLWVGRLGTEIQHVLSPTVDLHQMVAATPMPWFPIVSCASTAVLCLALAIVVVNRKELSYASG